MARNRTIDKDKGYTKVLREFAKHDGSIVDVGYFDDALDDEGFPIAAIAAVQEYGSEDGRIPERSFVRSTVDKNRTKYRKLLRELVAKVAVGDLTNAQALERFGIAVKADIQRTITDIRTPENAESTKDRKGFDNPLIDEGIMRASTDYKVST